MNSVRDIARGVRKRARLAAAKTQFKLTGKPEAGMLTIVVPMYDVEAYIVQCIESLMHQEYRNVQILVVDDGSPDNSYELVRELARHDARIEIVRQANAGLSAARNTGARHARGEYLTFLDSDDYVERDGYRRTVESLEQSGSDFAVMLYRREKDGTFFPSPAHVRAAHAQELIGVALKDHPEIMQNTIATSKVFRKSFWDAESLEFEHSRLYEDQMFSMEVFAAAKAIDVLPVLTLNYRIRTDGTSITQNTISVRNLRDFEYAVRASLQKLSDRGATSSVEARVIQLFNVNYLDFLPYIARMDDEGWDYFMQTTQFLASHTTTEMWQELEARRKVLIQLCLNGERALAEAFLEAHGWQSARFPGTISGDLLVADFPLAQEISAVVPAWALEFSLAETAVRCVLRGVSVADGYAELRLMAAIEHLRIEEPHTIAAALVSADGAERIPVDITRQYDEAGVAGFAKPYSDMRAAGAVARLPLAQLPTTGEFQLEVTITAGTLVRTGLGKIDGDTVLPVAMSIGQADGAERVLSVDGLQMWPFTVRLSEPQFTITSVECSDELVFSGFGRRDTTPRELLICTSPKPNAMVLARTPLSVDPATGRWTAQLPAPEPRGHWGPGPHIYTLLIADPDDSREYVWTEAGRSIQASERWQIAPPLPVRGTIGSRADLTDLAGCVLVTDIVIDDESVTLELAPSAMTDRLSSASLELAGLASQPAEIVRDGAKVSITAQLTQDRWGLGSAALPSGRYNISLQDAEGRELESCLAADLFRRFPIQHYGKLLRVTAMRAGKNQPVLGLSAPRAAEQWSQEGRLRLLAEASHIAPNRTKPLVLFRNRWGEHANDSALAVYTELAKYGDEFDLVWSVKDYAQHVPAGAKTVLEETPEFYEALRTATHIMVNVLQPIWHVKPEGQQLIQTHHGYPFKLTGPDMWEKLGYLPARITELLERSTKADYLVSPAAYATPLLAEFYPDREISSTVLEIGYPRNDMLLAKNADEIAADTRRRIGIPDGARAVLYAPTYRDYLSPNQSSAAMIDHIDPAQLAAELGDDYVVLLRGHAFNLGKTGESAGVIDVTDYPDINHLILASDLAILDYSSLRFDYALVNKPTLFFVPDEHEYFEARGGFMPFRETVYGPLITEADELAPAVRNAAAIAESHQAERLSFIAKYMELEDGRAAERLVARVFGKEARSSDS